MSNAAKSPALFTIVGENGNAIGREPYRAALAQARANSGRGPGYRIEVRNAADALVAVYEDGIRA